jgi:hypothetical protein
MWIRRQEEGALVRGEAWCVRLSGEELRDLINQARVLQKLLGESKTSLMPDEDITLTAQTEHLELYLTGALDSYTLSLRLYYGRVFEGDWSAGIAPSVLEELSHFRG